VVNFGNDSFGVYLFNRTGRNKEHASCVGVPFPLNVCCRQKYPSPHHNGWCCFHIHDDKVVSLTCALFSQPQADSGVKWLNNSSSCERPPTPQDHLGDAGFRVQNLLCIAIIQNNSTVQDLLVIQLVKEFRSSIEPAGSFPCSHASENGSYSEPLKSASYLHALFL